MSGEYRKNHYVPVWYQKRFIPPDAKHQELLYLDLRPGTFVDERGVTHDRKAVRRLGPKHCFYERDLYTISLGAIESTEIERLFFGEIDSRGRDAVEHFGDFEHCKAGQHEAFQDLIPYMSTQKLRTPKGLLWLRDRVRTSDRNMVLQFMTEYRQLFGALWTESVWLIADASQSETKFLVSDHPVTVYNRRCGPRSQWCRGHNDPDIWLNATHTIFPLSFEKVLLLTNLSWVRNPYHDPVKSRPNPRLFRNAMFYLLGIQTDRHLGEQEVREINFIIKSRALRYVAAGKEGWLHPEEFVSKSNWAQFGHGYLLMPDPRSVSFSSEIIMGFKDGSATAYDAYGRRPWERDYKQASADSPDEFYTSEKFKGEFARLFGPYRRGRSFEMGHLCPEKDTDYLHNYHVNFGRRKRR
ncbi:MAG: DUF4238 domain-containing protein [Blastocatellia bacterium]|nr:DUF4238 domain-containing protein [Blastocatellia bacterium]